MICLYWPYPSEASDEVILDRCGRNSVYVCLGDTSCPDKANNQETNYSSVEAGCFQLPVGNRLD